MGARRRKLNRELLGIDRADERDDEESFLGSQGSGLLLILLLISSSSLSLHSSSHSVTAFVYLHNGFSCSLYSLFDDFKIKNRRPQTTERTSRKVHRNAQSDERSVRGDLRSRGGDFWTRFVGAYTPSVGKNGCCAAKKRGGEAHRRARFGTDDGEGFSETDLLQRGDDCDAVGDV